MEYGCGVLALKFQVESKKQGIERDYSGLNAMVQFQEEQKELEGTYRNRK